MNKQSMPRLDPREEHFHIPAQDADLSLFLRYLPPSKGDAGIVLYVHGATFPSALSVAHRFDGRSWRDHLNDAGFHVWALDFLGYGFSDPYPEMTQPEDAAAPLGRAAQASRQIVAALRFISQEHRGRLVSLIAHSWGSIAAGRAAGDCPELIDRIVFFGHIAQRPAPAAPPCLPAWKTVTLEAQWTRFIANTPRSEAPVMLERHFRDWGERYLDCDPDSRSRTPHAVKVPLGPIQDIQEAWAGNLAYDPARIRAPLVIIRGAWDSLCTDKDATWLFEAATASPIRRDIKLSRGGHLMHLEEGRPALHRVARDFLQAGDTF